MIRGGGKKQNSSRRLERIIFGPINSLLNLLVARTRISKRIFDFFGRVLPVPQMMVRGVPIKVILPLNQVGVYNTFKDWESREPEVLDWIDRFEAGCVFFDVGASFGTETLYAALKPGGPKKIVSFDLDLESAFALAYNISLNNITKVDNYFLALSGKYGLYPYISVTQYYYIEGKPKYDTVKYNTLTISMDKFINTSRLFPNYIKIDVDGAEEGVISGMTETVKNKKLRSVAIEVSHKSEPVIVDFFHQAGFTVEFSRPFEEEGVSYKNIIFTRH